MAVLASHKQTREAWRARVLHWFAGYLAGAPEPVRVTERIPAYVEMKFRLDETVERSCRKKKEEREEAAEDGHSRSPTAASSPSWNQGARQVHERPRG